MPERCTVLLDRLDAIIVELNAVRAEVAALVPPPAGNGLGVGDDFTSECMIEISTAVECFNRPADTLRYWFRHEACG
jgi:hypothetical protein